MAGPITQGKDFNFYQEVTVTNASFPHDADVEFNFRGQQSFSLVIESGTRVEYSFNGNTLHGSLVAGTATEAIMFDNRRVSRIWFRTTSTSTVRVEAWAKV